jgi:hypothetical protein
MLAAALLVPGQPASAATADRFGFAYVKDPTVAPWTPLPAGYQFGSWPSGPTATGGKVGTGHFQVRFPTIGLSPRGNVHVTAVADDGRFCETVKWARVLSDEVVDVACFRAGGAPEDTPFTVLWTFSTGTVNPATDGAYASAQVQSTGSLVQSYNSAGASVSAGLVAPAIYEVVFKGVGSVLGDLSGDVQVTALNTAGLPARCKILRWGTSGSDAVVYVMCHDPVSGRARGSDFTISFHRERSVYASFGPPKYFGYIATPFAGQTNFQYPLGFGANGWGPTGTGTYIVKFPLLHEKFTTAHVTAYGDDPGYCTIEQLWSQYGTDAVVPVACFDNTGSPDKLEFNTTFSSSD